MSHYSGRGGIFEGQLDSGHVRDVSQFPTVGSSAWPPGKRSVVGQTPHMGPVGFRNIGMGNSDAMVSKPIVPRSTVTGHVSAYDYGNGMRPPSGFTSRGGILDGATVETGQPGRGKFFEEASPKYVGTGIEARSIPDRLAPLNNVAQANITLAPRPLAGFGQATMPSRPIPVSVSFARPRMLGRSIFEGPVLRDAIPQAITTPAPTSIAGFGAGPDGLGSSCGCGGWKSY